MPTIRAHLRRKTIQYLAITVSGWVVFTAAILVRAIPPLVMMVAFVAVVVAMLGLILGIRCPSCSRRVAPLGLAEVWAPQQARRNTHCPHCRTSLDAKMAAR